jgi:hypothetical protein
MCHVCFKNFCAPPLDAADAMGNGKSQSLGGNPPPKVAERKAARRKQEGRALISEGPPTGKAECMNSGVEENYL